MAREGRDVINSSIMHKLYERIQNRPPKQSYHAAPGRGCFFFFFFFLITSFLISLIKLVGLAAALRACSV
jgi:hypothetical protein